MPEAPIKPQFTLSENGDLIFDVGDVMKPYFAESVSDEERHSYVNYLERKLNQISDKPGMQVFAGDDSHTYLSTNVHDHLAQFFNIRRDERLGEYLYDLGALLPYHLADGIDHVFTIDWVTPYGLDGLLFPHMQRWLQDGGLAEGVAVEAVNTMALPFDADVQRRVQESIKYKSNATGQGIEAFCMRIASTDDTFSVMREQDPKQDETELGSSSQQYGEVTWRNLSLETLGSCACWGVEGMDKDDPPLLRFDHLYQMGPHNIDMARQSVSHILGMAVLSRHATTHEGREDVYADAVWQS